MEPTIAESDPSGATRLDLYARRIIAGAELPMFSKRLLDLLALPNSDHMSAQKLAAVVLEDYALTFKLLRMANSFHYNRSNKAIESVSHAIVVLGMQTVLKLASTLTFLQFFEQHTGELRRLMIRSMLSAHVAAVTADAGRFLHREEAYLAGMFCNLGEVLVAHQSPVRLAAVHAGVEAGSSLDTVTTAEFGFTFDRLADVVGAHWKLALFLTALWTPKAAPSDTSRLARFGHELTRLMCVRTAEHREPGLQLLLLKYGAPLQITTETLPDIWGRAVDDAGHVCEPGYRA